MMITTTSPQFSGLWNARARRNPQKRVEQFNEKMVATQQTEAAKATYQALAKPLFTDKHGEFRGWDLLLLLSKSGDVDGDIYQNTFLGQFDDTNYKDDVAGLLAEFARLGLTKTTCANIYWRLTDKGHQSLKVFKKALKKPGPLGKMGNYIFSHSKG